MDLEKRKQYLTSKVFFNKDINYSVNICPDNKHQYFGKPERLKKFRQMIYEHFLILNDKDIDYYFIIECSEPTSKSEYGPRLHLHGVIRFKTNTIIRDFLINKYYQLLGIGILEFDTIQQLDIWEAYIHKQVHIMQQRPLTNHHVEKGNRRIPWQITEGISK